MDLLHCISQVFQPVQVEEELAERHSLGDWSRQWHRETHGSKVLCASCSKACTRSMYSASCNDLPLFRFAKLGAKLILWDINKEANEAVAEEIKELGKTAHPYVCDCSKREEIYRVAEQVTLHAKHACKQDCTCDTSLEATGFNIFRF